MIYSAASFLSLTLTTHLLCNFIVVGCVKGHYREFGSCHQCPSTEMALAIVAPIAANSGFAFFTYVTLVIVTFISLRIGVKRLSSSSPQRVEMDVPTRIFTLKYAAQCALQFTIYVIKTLQLIALSLKGAQNPLPEFLSTAILTISVVLLKVCTFFLFPPLYF